MSTHCADVLYYIEGAEPKSVQHGRFPATMITYFLGGDVFPVEPYAKSIPSTYCLAPGGDV